MTNETLLKELTDLIKKDCEKDEKWQEKSNKINEEVRKRSGSIDIKSKLVDFLYTLMRDKLPPGEIETLVRDVEVVYDGTPNKYSNGWLAKYAEDLANRLQDKEEIKDRKIVLELRSSGEIVEMLAKLADLCLKEEESAHKIGASTDGYHWGEFKYILNKAISASNKLMEKYK